MAQSLRINHDISSLDDYVSIQNDHRHLREPVTLRQDRWDALAPGELNMNLLAQNRIIAQSRGPESLHFDVLRTRIFAEISKQNWTKLAIVSPTHGCGKTNVALNLAMSFSKQSDSRTILLDLDFQAPAISRLMGMGNGPALSSCLLAQEEFGHIAKRFGTSLAVAGDEHPADLQSDLLCSQKLSDALATIEHVYQPGLMLVDTPPMLQFHDIADITPHIDCALLVIDAQSTAAREVDLCERDLARQTNVLGIVLNKCHESECEYQVL